MQTFLRAKNTTPLSEQGISNYLGSFLTFKTIVFLERPNLTTTSSSNIKHWKIIKLYLAIFSESKA